jgi:hypothetical protein
VRTAAGSLKAVFELSDVERDFTTRFRDFRRTKKRFEQLLDEVGRSPPRQVRPKMKCRPADRIKPRAVARAALQYRRNQPKNHDHDSLQS